MPRFEVKIFILCNKNYYEIFFSSYLQLPLIRILVYTGFWFWIWVRIRLLLLLIYLQLTLLLLIYLPLTKKFYIALDKVNRSQPKMEKLHIYIKASMSFFDIYWLFIKIRELSCREIKWNLLGEYMFCITRKNNSLGPKLLFLC